MLSHWMLELSWRSKVLYAICLYSGFECTFLLKIRLYLIHNFSHSKLLSLEQCWVHPYVFIFSQDQLKELKGVGHKEVEACAEKVLKANNRETGVPVSLQENEITWQLVCGEYRKIANMHTYDTSACGSLWLTGRFATSHVTRRTSLYSLWTLLCGPPPPRFSKV